jgi:hypothetical protein
MFSHDLWDTDTLVNYNIGPGEKIVWENKSPTEIINDINNFIDKYKNCAPWHRPSWSRAYITDKIELERLEGVRRFISIHFNVPINSIMFFGTTSEKHDIWYLSSERKIIKIRRLEWELTDIIETGV